MIPEYLIPIPEYLIPVTVLMCAAALVPLIDAICRKAGFERSPGIVATAAFAIAFAYLLKEAASLPLEGSFRPFGGTSLGVELKVDSLSVYMSLVFCGLGLAASLYSIEYMKEDTGLDRFFLLLLTLVAGMMGVVSSNDFFNLYVFWEFMALSSYALVSFRKYTWEAVEAGFKYLVMSTLGSLAVLYGISILYGLAGTTNFEGIRQVLAGSTSEAAYLALALIIAGFGVTAALVPFHTWLPDAHPAAPSSISAMLSGVVIKTGAYAILWSLFKIFDPGEYGYGAVLMGFGALTMTVANVMAIMQRDVKRFLAYSSIANMGYIITGLGIAARALGVHGDVAVASLALLGALFHVLNHALGKGLSFLCAGCLIHEVGTRDIREMEGIGAKMPATAGSMAVGLLTLAGVPPLSGFWSKLFIVAAGLGIPGDPYMVLITALFIANSVIAAAYYLWLLQRLAFKSPTERASKAKEVSAIMLAPVVALAAMCILVTIFLGPTIRLIEYAVGVIVGG